VLAAGALLLLLAVNARTDRLIPLFTIGVFVGFTISQVGLVRHWRTERPARRQLRAAVNGAGTVMTAVAVVVFLATKFLEGAWVVVVAVPMLIFLFNRTEVYYEEVGRELRLGRTPPRPVKRESIVVVPTSTVNLLTERAVSAAMSLGDTEVAVAVAADEQERRQIRRDWAEWTCGPPVEVVIDKHRSLVRGVLRYAESIEDSDAVVTVLLPGYETATPDTLWRRFISTPGQITIAPDHITCRLNSRTYSPIMRTADLPDLPIHWWNNRPLRFRFS